MNQHPKTMGCCLFPSTQQPPAHPIHPAATAKRSTRKGLILQIKLLQKSCFSTHPLQQPYVRQKKKGESSSRGYAVPFFSTINECPLEMLLPSSPSPLLPQSCCPRCPNISKSTKPFSCGASPPSFPSPNSFQYILHMPNQHISIHPNLTLLPCLTVLPTQAPHPSCPQFTIRLGSFTEADQNEI